MMRESIAPIPQDDTDASSRPYEVSRSKESETDLDAQRVSTI
jgi:hypothetical protein